MTYGRGVPSKTVSREILSRERGRFFVQPLSMHKERIPDGSQIVARPPTPRAGSLPIKLHVRQSAPKRILPYVLRARKQSFIAPPSLVSNPFKCLLTRSVELQ